MLSLQGAGSRRFEEVRCGWSFYCQATAQATAPSTAQSTAQSTAPSTAPQTAVKVPDVVKLIGGRFRHLCLAASKLSTGDNMEQ